MFTFEISQRFGQMSAWYELLFEDHSFLVSVVTKTISVAMSADEGSSKIVSCRWLSGLRSSLDGSADLEKILKQQVVLLSDVFLRKETTSQRYISSIRLFQKQCNSFTMRHVGKKHW